jgi:alpha-ketoglutarate-dependent taurine dioxygenase
VEVVLLYCPRRQAENPEYQCFFKYARGSLAFWDNRRCVPQGWFCSWSF